MSTAPNKKELSYGKRIFNIQYMKNPWVWIIYFKISTFKLLILNHKVVFSGYFKESEVKNFTKTFQERHPLQNLSAGKKKC